jgi:hypothetical protein
LTLSRQQQASRLLKKKMMEETIPGGEQGILPFMPVPTAKPSRPGKSRPGKKEEQPQQPTRLVPTALEPETPEEKAFWALWCRVWFNDVPPIYNATAREHVKVLAQSAYLKTDEQLDSCIKFTRKEVEANQGYHKKVVALGNIRASYQRWVQTQLLDVAPAENQVKDVKAMTEAELLEYLATIPLGTNRGSPRYDEYRAIMDQLSMQKRGEIVRERMNAFMAANAQAAS